MTTEIIGQLPCPECNTIADLKTDGRKHTLKCHHCGLLAYYQTQQAKQHIEQRLDVQRRTNTGVAGSKGAIENGAHSALHASQQDNIITLQLPNHSDAQQRYILTLEQLAIEPVNGEMTTVNTNELPANDQELASELTDGEDDQPQGFFARLVEDL